MSAKRVIGVDLGGTKILAGALDGDGRVLARNEVATPTGSQEELLEGIAAAIEPLARDGLDALGLGVPSVVDPSSGVALGSINIPLADVALVEDFGRRFGVPVAVENDANVAALAEWKLGAGRGRSSLVMLTLGTGVGGGIVLDGGLYRGWAELGHVVVVADGPPCQGNCTGRGHLEAVASGNAADRAAVRLWGEGRDGGAARHGGRGGGWGGGRGAAGDGPAARRGSRQLGERVRPGALRRRRRLRPRRGAVPLPARARDGAARGARSRPQGPAHRARPSSAARPVSSAPGCSRSRAS